MIFFGQRKHKEPEIQVVEKPVYIDRPYPVEVEKQIIVEKPVIERVEVERTITVPYRKKSRWVRLVNFDEVKISDTEGGFTFGSIVDFDGKEFFFEWDNKQEILVSLRGAYSQEELESLWSVRWMLAERILEDHFDRQKSPAPPYQSENEPIDQSGYNYPTMTPAIVSAQQPIYDDNIVQVRDADPNEERGHRYGQTAPIRSLSQAQDDLPVGMIDRNHYSNAQYQREDDGEIRQMLNFAAEILDGKRQADYAPELFIPFIPGEYVAEIVQEKIDGVSPEVLGAKGAIVSVDENSGELVVATDRGERTFPIDGVKRV